jgi:GT2 family glycosyltransferase
VAAAEEGVILICDADDIVCAGWVEALAAAVTAATWAAGPLDYERLNSPRTRSMWGAPSRMPLPGPTPFRDVGHGSNCGFSTAMWRSLGGFDTEVKGHGDDTDFFMRAWAGGYSLRWAPSAVVHHRQRSGRREVVIRRFQQGKAQVAMTQRAAYPALARHFPRSRAARAVAAGSANLMASVVRRCPAWHHVGTVALNVGRLVGQRADGRSPKEHR